MFQTEPAYLQVSTGYAIPHGLPEYTFEETPLRLTDGRSIGGAGPGGIGSSAATTALLYSTPLFSGNSAAGVGPAPSGGAAGSFNFQRSTTRTASSSSTAGPSSSSIAAPSHHRPSLPILLKMEQNADDMVAQEAAARDYQPQLEVRISGGLFSFFFLLLGPWVCLSSLDDPALTKRPALLTGTARRQEDAQQCHHGRVRKGRPRLCAKDHGA